MRIVITGAGGLLGGALTQHLSAAHEVIALRHSDLDITQRQSVRQLILSERPNLVINCAVIGVDLCEREPKLAEAINILGPQYLAEATAEAGAEMLHISTNYVFDGRVAADYYYTIEDEPSPINIYGRTKLEGERAVRAANQRSYILRTSWVFGQGKESFLSTAHRRLQSREPLRAMTDLRASATYALDFAKRLEEILKLRRYATYHIVNSGICSYQEFATEAARILGLTDTETENLIVPISAIETERPATRPRHTSMRCLVSEELGLKPLRSWRDALKDYIQEG